VVAQGIRHVRALIEKVFGEDTINLPVLARIALRPLVAQLMELRLQIKTIEKELLAWHRTSQESRRLETIPGVGFITATAIAATVADPSHFRSSREFSARDKIHRAERTVLATSRRWVTAICVHLSSSEPRR
jgi:transposase